MEVQANPLDPDADPRALARTIALRKLTVRAQTRHELEQALARRSVPDEAADAVLDRLEDVGLIDDGQFAHDWVESRQLRRTLSRRALQRELQNKGVDRDVIDEALAPIGTDEELTAARAFVARKWPSMRSLDPLVRRRRLTGALGRRGFGAGVVSRVLGEFAQSASEGESDDLDPVVD